MYPNSKKINNEEDYYGVAINDPYRWLESSGSDEVLNWLSNQESYSKEYLESIPFRSKIRSLVEANNQITRYDWAGVKIKVGNYYIYKMYNNKDVSGKIFIQNGRKGEPEVLIDPLKYSENGEYINISIAAFSNNEEYAVFRIFRSGSDWFEQRIIKISTKTVLPDVIKWSRFGMTQFWNNGFFYIRFDSVDVNNTSNNTGIRLCYHSLGDKQSDDHVVFDKSNTNHVTDITSMNDWLIDDGYLLISVLGLDYNEFYTLGLSEKLNKPTRLFEIENNVGLKYCNSINSRMVFITNQNAERGKVILVDAANPTSSNWVTLIPEIDYPLINIVMSANKIYATYLKDVKSVVYQYSMTGLFEKEIQLPCAGTVTMANGAKDDKDTVILFNSFLHPPSFYLIDSITGEIAPFHGSTSSIQNRYRVNQVFYKSWDGTNIPMYIITTKDYLLNGNNPTILLGYGGFGISNVPFFSLMILTILELGGTFAIANIRGGGEYGNKWHNSAILNKKHVAFNDYISAAEYLISEKYTNKEMLAAYGGSNGALLVTASMNLRPDLFKVVVAISGIYDMLRYHKFGIGKLQVKEYGSSDNEDQFLYLLSYSPLHNTKPNIDYPAIMIMTSDNDNRCYPFHSYKYTATLQSSNPTGNPIILRIDKGSGHELRSVNNRINEITDTLSFIFYNIDYKSDPTLFLS